MPPPGQPGLPAPGVRPAGAVAVEDDDDDDEPDAKKPRLDDGSLVQEAQWIAKHPMPIQILVQVNLGADALAANIPQVVPLEVSVRTKVLEMKQMLLPRVSPAGVNLATMKLKAQ